MKTWEVGCPYGIIANVLDCEIVVRLNSSQAIMFTFELIPLRKVWNFLFPQQWVK